MQSIMCHQHSGLCKDVYDVLPVHRALGNASQKGAKPESLSRLSIMVYKISSSSPLMPKAASAFPCHKSSSDPRQHQLAPHCMP